MSVNCHLVKAAEKEVDCYLRIINILPLQPSPHHSEKHVFPAICLGATFVKDTADKKRRGCEMLELADGGNFQLSSGNNGLMFFQNNEQIMNETETRIS